MEKYTLFIKHHNNAPRKSLISEERPQLINSTSERKEKSATISTWLSSVKVELAG